MNNFVLVGTQRSGTTMLRSALDSHPGILCLGEVFYINNKLKVSDGTAIGRDLSEGFSAWRKHSYQSYIAMNASRSLRHWFGRAGLVNEYLDYIYSLEPDRAVGFKMMANQNRRFPGIPDYIIRNNIRVIHMLRENPLDIYLSRLLLQARGYAHSAKHQGEKVKVHMPVDSLLDVLRTLYAESRYLTGLFEGKVQYLMIGYDEFVQDRDNSSRRLLEFLGFDDDRLLAPELVKLNTSSMSESIENYAAVYQVLSSSEFAWCLPES